jgi:hypothetical protein
MGKRKVDWSRIRWGTLTEWCRRHNAEIRKLAGKTCFARNGELNDRTLRYLYDHPEIIKRISKTHWRRIWRKIHFKLHVLKG